MLNSENLKLWNCSYCWYTSPKMIMKNYEGFIKDSHLKVDINIDLFKNVSDTLKKSLKKAW